MNDRLYIATFSEGCIETAKKYGLGIELNDICISEYLDDERVEDTICTMEKELENAGLCRFCEDGAVTAFDSEKVIMHGPFTEIIPASIDHRAVSLGLERLEEAYRVCRRMGIGRMVVHSGYMPLLYFKEWHLEKSIDFWTRFMADKPSDFTIYIENVFEDEPMMMKQLAEGLHDPRIQLCLDIGHANAMTLPAYTAQDWVRELGPYIGHFHLHNNNGQKDQHDSVQNGSMDMTAILDTIAAHCSNRVTMTIESRACADSTKWLLQYRDKEYLHR